MKSDIRILVVEDEEAIRSGVCDVLAYHGYRPEAAETGEDGLQRGRQEAFDLVILDVMLPGMDGFSVCEKLRAERPQLSILMLTAKGSEDDVVHGLRLGADDYVTKPFSIRELVARVEALLRRTGKLDRAESFTFGIWQVDAKGLRATFHDTSSKTDIDEVALTAREVDLLRLFAREAGRVVSRRRLLREIWEMVNVDDIETRTVDVHIAKLRKKIDLGPKSWIRTVRGAGYRAMI